MIRDEIIMMFFEFLDDFFMQNINSTINNTKLQSSLHLGVQTMIRVFEYSLYQTKSLEKSYIYLKTGETYFLEYLEQMSNSGYIEDVNLNEIILFVYKKTIFNIKNKENNENIINNMMTLSDTYLVFDEDELNNIFNEIRKCVNVLFFWKNKKINNNQRVEINQKFFHSFFYYENKEDMLKMLEYIQYHFEYEYNDYKNLLKEFVDINKKNKMKHIDEHIILDFFYCNKETLIENNKKMTTKQFAKWLLV